MNIGEKIRLIRESEGLTREDMQQLTGIHWETISSTERGRSKPNSDKLQAICTAFPHYTLWLMADMTEPDAGQVSPEDYATVNTWLVQHGRTLPKAQVIALVGEVVAALEDGQADEAIIEKLSTLTHG